LKDDEYYICIYAERAGNVLLFHHEGGVDIGDVDAKATKLSLDIEETLNTDRVLTDLIAQVPKERQRSVVFIRLCLWIG
jgi:ATP citrate (pro-S)-lyase